MTIINYLSKHLSIDIAQMSKFVSTCPYRYKVYDIPKRNGKGTRTIAQPSKELKYLQRTVAAAFLDKLPVHDVAMAYRKGRGIKDNTKRHAGKKYLLKMDFENFFPSIRAEHLIKHVEKYLDWNIGADDKITMEKLFFYAENRSKKSRLSIGSPTSPLISNSIMFDFDSKINDICHENDVIYTRYADDLAFSTNTKDLLFKLPGIIDDTLSSLGYSGLKINKDKTIFLSRKGNMHITGLVLTVDGKVSIGRAKKRQIKSLVFKFLHGSISEEDQLYLSGYLAFCFGAEPDFIFSLEKKYGKETISTLLGSRNGKNSDNH